MEGTIGKVPNRVSLRGRVPSLNDPDWTPGWPETLYSRLRIRRAVEQRG